jgi:hypothetical protein
MLLPWPSLPPTWSSSPPKFTLAQRREIEKIAKSKPAEHNLPFSTWSVAKLAGFLVAEGVVDDISHEGLRGLLRQEGVTFQRLKTWQAVRAHQTAQDPDPVPGILPLPALSLPTHYQDRDHLR